MAGISSKEIKTRIRSMKSTRQITKAMEMVAASKLRRAQGQMMNSRPYFETLYDTIADILGSDNEISSPYLNHSANPKTLFVVIAGDRGLAGGYNSNILKLCQQEMKVGDLVLPIGKKASEFYKNKDYPVFGDSSTDTENISVSHCFSVAKLICKAFSAGTFGQIRIGYTHFVSVLSQAPTLLTALPLPQQKSDTNHCSEIVYEPNGAAVLDAIIPEYIGGILYGAVCESRTSEQAARRTAMDAATQNADDIIAELNLKYNQARQAAITQEITEIIAGA